jgi:hypothetical protein
MSDTIPKFIVAEVSKTWIPGTPISDLLSQKFEKVINVNDERGYSLKEWKLSTTIHNNTLTETIIAIFEKQ